jgi:eukaryotic-like serine/threonine-protein kinase
MKLPRPGTFDDAAVARLTREAQVGASIHHPNVCAVTDAGWLDDGSPFLVMERLYGETLGAYVSRLGPLDAEVAIDIALQVLAGLSAAHAVGVVHRDVKPDNVFLVHRHGCPPLAKLLDFGLCCRAGARREEVALTRAGTVVGTPEYMSPEQASGWRAFDARTDLYAVGVILYECLTGARAFVADDVSEVLTSVLAKSLPPLRTLRRDLPTSLDGVVARAMCRDPRARYRDAIELQRALLDVRDELPRSRRTSDVVPSAPSATTGEWEPPTRQMAAARRSRRSA